MAFSEEKCKTIADRQALVAYIRELVADFQAHPDEWENQSLPDYLLAMAAWMEDMEGYYQNKGMPVPTSPSWATIAEILSASSVYE